MMFRPLGKCQRCEQEPRSLGPEGLCARCEKVLEDRRNDALDLLVEVERLYAERMRLLLGGGR